MKRYIKPETGIVCTDVLNDVMLSTSSSVGDEGQYSKGNAGWDDDEGDGNNGLW